MYHAAARFVNGMVHEYFNILTEYWTVFDVSPTHWADGGAGQFGAADGAVRPMRARVDGLVGRRRVGIPAGGIARVGEYGPKTHSRVAGAYGDPTRLMRRGAKR